jgi:hypothetical protein
VVPQDCRDRARTMGKGKFDSNSAKKVRLVRMGRIGSQSGIGGFEHQWLAGAMWCLVRGRGRGQRLRDNRAAIAKGGSRSATMTRSAHMSAEKHRRHHRNKFRDRLASSMRLDRGRQFGGQGGCGR